MSAGDASQEAWYEAQLQLKQEAGELPKVPSEYAALILLFSTKVPFLCVADPPGPRVGSGGSTLHILALLEAKHPGKLDQWKVTILNLPSERFEFDNHSQMCAGVDLACRRVQQAASKPQL